MEPDMRSAVNVLLGSRIDRKISSEDYFEQEDGEVEGTKDTWRIGAEKYEQ